MALALGLTTTGSVESPSGMAGGPTGLPRLDGSSLNSNLGLAFIATTLPEVSGAPASIHALIAASSASGILGEAGGIFGSSAWETSCQRCEPSRSPGSTTLPDPPPCIVEPKVSRLSPPLALSAL